MSWYYKGEKNPIQKKQLLLKKSVYWIKLDFFCYTGKATIQISEA